MAASVTHKAKAGSLLTGTEYEAADSHVVSVAHTDLSSVTADQHHNQSHTQADHTGTGSTSTQAFGDAAAAGSGTKPANIDHVHGMPTNPTTDIRAVDVLVGTATAAFSGEIVVGTSPGGELGGTWASPTVDATHAGSTHLTLGTSPSTQAFGDSAAGGSATDAAKTDHKHAMPTLGFGLTGNSAPAVSLTNQFVKATATTSVSAASYADVTGLALSSLAAGTWLLIATVTGSSVNAHALMHVAITDNSNVVQVEGSSAIPASGSANVASNGSVTLSCIVSGGQVFKVRAARGNTTLTGTWTAMDGAGIGVTNNLTDNSDKGSYILAVRIA